MHEPIARASFPRIALPDREAVAALWTEDAILDDYSVNQRSEGRDQIVGYISTWPTLYFQPSAEPMKVGDYVVQPTIVMEAGNPLAPSVHVFEITGDGRIQHLWFDTVSDE